ncbi:MAG: hypothetical protein IJF39_00140 [Clostridia bacterium]|nr:hypothetical protein [Clostridia bacterium]
MNSAKLWHTFAIIVGYLCTVAFISCGIGALNLYHWHWGIPFGVGIALWIASILFYVLREKHSKFYIFPLPMSAIACGLLIGAFILGENCTVYLNTLVPLALLVSACYVLLMLLFTVQPLKHRIWYQVVCYILWLGSCIALTIFAVPTLLPKLPQNGMFLLFFLLLLGFLSLGSMIETEDFAELWTSITLPAFAATGIIGVIVLLVITDGDGCDACDCGDCGCSKEKGKHIGTGYTKKQKTTATMDSISRGEL